MSEYEVAEGFAQEWASALEHLSGEGRAQKIAEFFSRADFSYGIAGAVKRSVGLRWPHHVEQDSQGNCGERAIAAYMFADAAGLSPELVYLRDVDSYHGAIVMDTGEKKLFLDPGQKPKELDHLSLSGVFCIDDAGVFRADNRSAYAIPWESMRESAKKYSETFCKLFLSGKCSVN